MTKQRLEYFLHYCEHGFESSPTAMKPCDGTIEGVKVCLVINISLNGNGSLKLLSYRRSYEKKVVCYPLSFKPKYDKQ
jgi:hypothetical protein